MKSMDFNNPAASANKVYDVWCNTRFPTLNWLEKNALICKVAIFTVNAVSVKFNFFKRLQLMVNVIKIIVFDVKGIIV